MARGGHVCGSTTCWEVELPSLHQSTPTTFCPGLFSPLWPYGMRETSVSLTFAPLGTSDYTQIRLVASSGWGKAQSVTTEIFHIIFLAIHRNLFMLEQLMRLIENFGLYNHDFIPPSSILRCVDPVSRHTQCHGTTYASHLFHQFGCLVLFLAMDLQQQSHGIKRLGSCNENLVPFWRPSRGKWFIFVLPNKTF